MSGPYVPLTKIEQLRAALPILLIARKAVAVDNAEPIDAIQQAGKSGIACWWARQVLLTCVATLTLQQWQLDPSVLKSDRTRAFDRAIRKARRAFGHKGGWRVTPVTP